MEEDEFTWRPRILPSRRHRILHLRPRAHASHTIPRKPKRNIGNQFRRRRNSHHDRTGDVRARAPLYGTEVTQRCEQLRREKRRSSFFKYAFDKIKLIKVDKKKQNVFGIFSTRASTILPDVRHTMSESALQQLCNERSFFCDTPLPRGVATHGTTDARLSKSRQLVVPVNSVLDFHRALLTLEDPSISEYIPDTFRFFMEVCCDNCFDQPSTRDLLYIIGSTITLFFPDETPLNQFTSLVFHTVGSARTRLRIVYPHLIVTRQRALKMHAMALARLASELQGEARRAISGHSHPLDEPVTGPSWTSAFPAEVYLSSRPHQMVLCPQFDLCSRPVARNRGHANCRCCNSCHEKVGQPLLLMGVFDRNGFSPPRLEEWAKILRADKLMLLNTASLRAESSGTPPTTTDWREPIGCPLVAFKETTNGPKLQNVFETELSGHKRHASRILVEDTATLSVILKEVRRLHARYRNCSLDSVFRSGVTGKHIFRVHLKGIGSSYCQNRVGYHKDSEQGCGRPYIVISAMGVSQHCYAQCTPASGIPCNGYKQSPKPLFPETRAMLGYFSSANTGDFWHQLENKLLPEISLRLQGKKPPKAGKRKLGN